MTNDVNFFRIAIEQLYIIQTKGKNMKKNIRKTELIYLVIALLLMFSGSFTFAKEKDQGEMHGKNQAMNSPAGEVPANDIQKAASCPLCGMDREKFAYSRMFIEFDDGSTLGTCSIHCAAVDLAVNVDKTPVHIWVGDYNTRQLIDAEKAVWVIGGDKPGVMTKRAKWAFGDRLDADQYIKEHGGSIAAFADAMKATYEDMYQDTAMIREKRKKMHMMNKNK
jgi:copper chaperone NosL